MTRLEQLQALNEQRTPGPWTRINATVEGPVGWPFTICEVEGTAEECEADVQFIPASANAMGDLLAVAAAAQSVRDSRLITADDAHLEHSLDELESALAPLLQETDA